MYAPNGVLSAAFVMLLLGFLVFLGFTPHAFGDLTVEIKFLFTVSIFVYVVHFVVRAYGLEYCLKLLLVAAVYSAAIEIYELLSGASISGMLYPRALTDPLRHAATFAHPNRLGSFLMLSLPYLLYLYQYRKAKRWLLLILLFYACILTAGSISALIGSILALFALIAIYSKRSLSRLVAIAALLLVAIPLVTISSSVTAIAASSFQRVFTSTDVFGVSSSADRLALGQEALRVLAADPRLMFTGIGFNAILMHNQLVFGRALFVHNVVLNTFLAWGVLGLLGISVVVIYTLAKSAFLLYGFMADRLRVSALEASLAVSCFLVLYVFQVYDAFIDKSLWIYIALLGAVVVKKASRQRLVRGLHDDTPSMDTSSGDG
jgi:hypothetical protein